MASAVAVASSVLLAGCIDLPSLTRPAAHSLIAPDPSRSSAPFRIFNIGNNQPVRLSDYIDALEDALGVTARRNLLPLQLE